MSDLGTYHVRVELVDGRGWIEQWNTGLRFTGGTDCWSPLNARLILNEWENEADLFNTIVYEYTEGNSSCDCNKSLALINAYQQFDAQEGECGDTMELRRLTVIRPDASEVVILEEGGKQSCLQGGEVATPPPCPNLPLPGRSHP